LRDGVRAFVAVELPADGGPSRAPAHLTLRFLGEITADQERSTEARLRDVAAASRPFVLRLEGIGAFPSPARPRVVWIGVTQGRAEVEELARRVRAALAPEFGPDRDRFVPHLTLARVRSSSDRRAAEELLAGVRPPPPPRDVAVRELVLKESVLGAGGAVHRTLAAFPLGAPARTA
jgi:RNA 2',3'-cyclic 3'-phosphodiesterase